MAERAPKGRPNQRLRTRKDLLDAAGRLLKQGGAAPDMDAVAAEAKVSRATAYRYFPTVESLLVEAPLDGVVPAPDALFSNDGSTDPAARVEKAEAAMHEMCYRNGAQLRLMLSARLAEAAKRAGSKHDDVPLRQNRRTPMIQAALAPARGRLSDRAYSKLCAALAVYFGGEAMVVLSDVLGLSEREARRVKAWACKALVEAALRESRASAS